VQHLFGPVLVCSSGLIYCTGKKAVEFQAMYTRGFHDAANRSATQTEASIIHRLDVVVVVVVVSTDSIHTYKTRQG